MQSRTATFDSGSYTDLGRLNAMKVGERDSDANVRKVAQEFESVFLNQMMKSMRAAGDVLADPDSPFNSQESQQYRDMYDQQLSVSLSRQGGGIGLADVLSRQLSKQKTDTGHSDPFAKVGQAAPARWPDSPAAAVEGRDDSKLLAMRRLALPGKLNRQTAQATQATTPAQALAGDGKPLVDMNWKAAQASAAPRDRALTVNGVEQDTSRLRFNSREEFVATLLPMAEKAARKLGVEPRYLVAQAALETGWGKSMIRQKDGTNSHNLFGIKSTAWQGESAQVTTTEYVDGKATRQVAGFRVYDSFEQSFNDYVAVLQNNDRYRHAVQVAGKAGDSAGFVRELQRAGYATDPNYARKVAQIARQMQTYQTVADAGSESTTLRSRG